MSEDPFFAEIFSDEVTADTPVDGSALDPDAVFDGAPSTAGGTHIDASAPDPRFEGDTSVLPAEVCWCLQELVAAPHITAKSRKHWAIVRQYETELRSRLAELGLVLELSLEHGYAFTRQAEDLGPRSRTILRTRTLSLAASALILYLYQQYLTAMDDPVVSTADMVDHMIAYKRPHDTDEAAFHKKIMTAIRLLDEVSIIKQIKGTDRYLIYGVITSILTADRVEELEKRYQAIISGDSGDDAATAESTDDE